MIDKTIAWDEYKSLDAMNPSTLVIGEMRSMLSLRNAIRYGFTEPTPAMIFGTDLHTLSLQPEVFEATYVVMPSFNLDPENLREPKRKDEPIADRKSILTTTNYCKAKEAEFVKQNQGKTIISRVNYDRALCCIEAINSKPHIAELIHCNNTEVTVTGEICGVECKGRLDILTTQVIADLKVTDNIHRFQKVFENLEYAFKLSMYWELVRQNGPEREVEIIVQESDGDFDNALRPVPREYLELSLNRVMHTLERYKQCKKTNVWPGFDQGELRVPMEIPYWQRKQLEDVDWSGVEVGEQVEQESYY